MKPTTTRQFELKKCNYFGINSVPYLLPFVYLFPETKIFTANRQFPSVQNLFPPKDIFSNIIDRARTECADCDISQTRSQTCACINSNTYPIFLSNFTKKLDFLNLFSIASQININF